MRNLFLAITLALVPISAQAVYEPLVITPSDAHRDAALLRRALETVHPGLYRYTDKVHVDAAFNRLEAATS